MKNCATCQNHRTYYTKCAKTFYRHCVGFCSECGRVTEKDESCEKWKKREQSASRRMHKRAAEEVIEKNSSDLSVIAQILTDDRLEEEKEKTIQGAD